MKIEKLFNSLLQYGELEINTRWYDVFNKDKELELRCTNNFTIKYNEDYLFLKGLLEQRLFEFNKVFSGFDYLFCTGRESAQFEYTGNKGYIEVEVYRDKYSLLIMDDDNRVVLEKEYYTLADMAPSINKYFDKDFDLEND